MRIEEIHHFLIDYSEGSVPIETIQAALLTSGWLRDQTEMEGSYIALRDRTYPIDRRIDCEAISAKLWVLARQWGAV